MFPTALFVHEFEQSQHAQEDITALTVDPALPKTAELNSDDREGLVTSMKIQKWF